MGRVRVKLPASLRLHWGGPPEIEVQAATLAEALRGLGPLASRVLDDTGQPREHVHLFVNARAVRDLATPVREGDIVHVLPAVSGGLA